VTTSTRKSLVKEVEVTRTKKKTEIHRREHRGVSRRRRPGQGITALSSFSGDWLKGDGLAGGGGRKEIREKQDFSQKKREEEELG